MINVLVGLAYILVGFSWCLELAIQHSVCMMISWESNVAGPVAGRGKHAFGHASHEVRTV